MQRHLQLFNRINARSLNTWRINRARAGREPAAVRPIRLVEIVPAIAPVPMRYIVRCGEIEVDFDERFDDETLLWLLLRCSAWLVAC